MENTDQYNIIILVFLLAILCFPLIFTMEADSEDEVVIFIKPSLDATCPAGPCYTLSQFATNQSQLIKLNTTLLFLSGNHSLNFAITITDSNYFSMLSQSPSKPNIHCQYDANITFNNISNMTIHGISFRGCGGNKISAVNQLTVESCFFIGNENSGTALNIIQSNAVFIDCFFLSNRVGTYHGPILILENQEEPSYTNFTLYAFVGGALIANQSSVSLVGSKFEKNHAGIGGAVFSTLGSQVSVINSTFTENRVCFVLYEHEYPICFGGVFYCEDKNSEVTIINSNFSHNRGIYGGVFTIFDQCTININSSRFSGNLAINYPGNGGVLYLQDSATASIHKSLFINNSASSAGGAVRAEHSVLIIHGSKFINNSVEQFGGVIYVIHGSLTIDGSYLRNNSAFQGGVINAYSQCSVIIRDSEFSNNEAKSDIDPFNTAGGVIAIMQSSKLNITRTLFYNNIAHTGRGGAVSISSKIELKIVNSSFIANEASVGGAIEIYQSDVNFFGFNNLTENTVDSKGGAIYFTGDSILNVNGDLTMMFNNAYDSGGGVYLYRSKLNCQFNSTIKLHGNKAVEKGGGIFAINAIVKVFSNRDSSVESAIIFEGNNASMGGGVYLELATELHVIKSGNDYTKTIYNLHFIENSARYGGAIYNADETNYEICASKSYYSRSHSAGTECFLQILAPMQTIEMKYNIVTTEFINNRAQVSGPILYGGLLDRCTLMLSAEILFTNRRTPLDGVTYFLNTSILNNTDGISSAPVQVCLCEPDISVPNCGLQELNIRVMRGEKFQVSLVAVDQVNRTLPNITVYSSLKYTESGLGEGQMAQITTNKCTVFNFSVLSPQAHEEITLYAESPCRNATKSQRNIRISFKNCACPIGFQPNTNEGNKCVCDCDPKLRQYVMNCSSQTDSVIREGNVWITYLNSTKSNTSNNYNYLIYPNCPLDYCLPPEVKVEVNLTATNGSDAQCAECRSGTLCGVCRAGHTLSLGSSRCIPCADEWPRYLAAILIVAPLLGIGLVAVMLILNLTVSKGTLNGIIFYANIINANSSTFFPLSSKKLWGVHTFVSWLTLDTGFDVCFFKGMDTYWKTWIQMAFPTYVILLVVVVMYLSDRSILFTRLISLRKKNPVETLATLVLLSYALFLRTVITTFPYVTLTYPKGPKMMWLPDATVAYLKGRHSILFIVAIVILVIGVLYTVLLFTWQWIKKMKKIHKITTYYYVQKLDHFIEVYHVPYRPEHRYWTGLLLLARVVLYLVFAFGNPSLNLLVIIAIICGLLFLKGHFGKIYDEEKSRFVDTIEMISYLNIALFSAATFFTTQTREYHDEVAFMSVSVTFVLFLFVLAYHIYTELLSNLFATLKLKIINAFSRGINSCTSSEIIQPTFSTITGIPERNAMHSILDEDKNDKIQVPTSCSIDKSITEKDDDTLSIDSTTPLLRDQTHN